MKRFSISASESSFSTREPEPQSGQGRVSTDLRSARARLRVISTRPSGEIP